MAQKSFWGDSMSLTTTETSAGTSITLARLNNVEIIPSFNVMGRLYSADSVKIADQKQGEFQVQVNIGVLQWGAAAIQHWLGGSGTQSTGLVDTSSPTKFNITGEISPADGSATNLSAAVTSVTFDQFPAFSATRNEYVQEDLSGVGEDITVTGP